MSDETIKTEEHSTPKRLEGRKLFYDFMKHMTTLSTGSIILLVVLVEKLFPNPSLKWLMVVVFSLFILCTISALLSMFMLAMTVFVSGDISDTEAKMGVRSVFTAIAFFLLGLLALIVFASINMY